MNIDSIKFNLQYRLIVLAFTILSIVGVSACEKDNSSTKVQQLPTLKIGTLFRALDYAPFYIAKEKGWLEEAVQGKAKIEYIPTFQTPPSANESMASGQTDIIMTAGVPAIVAQASGVNLRIPMLSCTLSSQIVVKDKSRFKRFLDLKGSRIAVAFGTGPHYGLIQHLDAAKLMPPAVELLDMVPPDAKAALQTKAVDAWAIFPPFIEQEILAGTGAVLPDVSSPVQVVVTVREETMVDHPELVNAVLNTLKRAKEWLKIHPAKAQDLLSKQLDLSPEVVKLGWERLDWSSAITDQNVHSDLQNKADFLFNEKFIKHEVNIKNILPEILNN